MATSDAALGHPEPSVRIEAGPEGATRVTVYAPDRPGLFYRVSAALAGAGAGIVDARIHTTRDGMALDNLLVHDRQGKPYADRRQRQRLARAIEVALGDGPPPGLPEEGPAAVFEIAPSVTIAEGASRRFTVVEIQAADRPGLLAALAGAIFEGSLTIHSAHIATYGERAVDVFYLTGANGRKLSAEEVARVKPALLAVARHRPTGVPAS
jgi:[protein-PII] uridylyltransferase